MLNLILLLYLVVRPDFSVLKMQTMMWMIEESVREDMQLLRESPLIPDDVVISGAVYDVDTGSMREVY